MSYVDNLSGQFGALGLGGSQSHQPPPPSGEHGDYGYHSANRDDARPAQYYASPPQPTYQPPSDKPPLPQGWIPLFDQSRQRWYYANQETGVTQWEAPGYVAPPPRPPMETYPSEESRGGGQSPYPPAVPYGHTPGGYSAPPGPPPSASYGAPPMPPAGYGAPAGEYGSHGQYGGHGEYGGRGEHGDYGEEKKKKKSSGSSGMLLGAAGGVAAGLVGGALLHHALEDSSSDEEEERPHYVQQPVIVNEYNNDYNEYNENYSSGPPAVLPPTDEDGNSVSSSDRESVQEAREEYEEALADAQDSDASSSDYEELAEAREEYEEEYEETYED